MLNPATPRLSRRQVPETPPASTSKKQLGGKLPVFALPNRTPKQQYGKHQQQYDQQYQQHKQLETPATNKINRVVDLGPPPSTSLPLLPQFTPNRSPHRRRRVTPGDLFALDAISMLLPNHAVSGSGRKTAGTLKSLKAPFLLACEELAKLNENLAFEEEAPSDSDNSDIEVQFKKFGSESIMDSPSKKPRRKVVRGLAEPHALDFHGSAVPSTPGKQIISEEQVRQWHGDSGRLEFVIDHQDWKEMKSEPLVNPFIDCGSTGATSRNTARNKSNINFDTHMELINHRTGERLVEPLSPSQKLLRPRRIDFSQI